MDFIVSILTAIDTTRSLGAIALEEIRRRHFTDEEKELLREAATTGEFRVTDAGPQALWIRVKRSRGDRHFMDERDPAVAAGFRQAFHSLAERRYVEHISGNLFMLTGDGFKKAKELASK